MCTIGAKYLPTIGWVGFKNRDRNYHAIVDIKMELDPIEKLYIWDLDTQYSEGINQSGVSILLASLVMNEDEREITVAQHCAQEGLVYSSPVGIKLREALNFTTPKTAVNALIEQQTTGHILVFNEKECFALEATLNNAKEYQFILTQIPKSEGIVVRSNHGINLKHAGYQVESALEDRTSSEQRRAVVSKTLEGATSLEAIMNAFSTIDNPNKQFNPIRFCTLNAEKQTTGQLMLIPQKRELHYRPIMGSLKSNLSLNASSSLSFKVMPSFERKLLEQNELVVS